MIIDKVPLPEDPTPADAPPSYDSVAGPSNPRPPLPTNEKSSASTSGAGSSVAQGDSLSGAKRKLQASHLKSKSWLPFGLGATRTARQVRATILKLVHGIITQLSEDNSQGGSDESAVGILESCADTCIMHDISLSTLLQEKSIEGHTPIYWAILKRPTRQPAQKGSFRRPSRASLTVYTPFDEETSDPSDPNQDLILNLLKFSAPLTENTRSEIRLACMLNSDDALFQCIRSTQVFAPVLGTDQILFGTPDTSSEPVDLRNELGRGIGSRDRVRVVNMTDDDTAFVAHLEVPLFQKRMRIGGQITLDFIAKGRLFRLSFLVADSTTVFSDGKYINPGTWFVSLEILEDSPATWVDSRLVIRESRYSHSPPDTPSTPGATGEVSPRSQRKPKPTISLRLKSSSQLVAGSRYTQGIQVRLDESLMGGNLTYDGASYFTTNGTLRAMLEARLVRPGTDCIIC